MSTNLATGQPTVDDSSINFLLQSIIEKSFTLFLKRVRLFLPQDGQTPTALPMMQGDLQVLYYAAGYIPKTLLTVKEI